MTEPLVPAEVDLRGYEFMPFYGHHLFGSDFNAGVSDAGWRAAVTLWWAAWNQVPAASLPNNEAALCKLADLGRDLKTWRKLRADALHGFIECTDGRLYHKRLAKWAIEAWEKREDNRAERERLKRHRNERKALFAELRVFGVVPAFDTAIETLRETLRKHAQERKTNTNGNVSGNENATVREESEGKRSESDTEKRDVGVTPTVEAVAAAPTKVNGAIENTGNSTPKSNGGGQQWSNPAWVSATANTLGITRHANEDDAGWKDRVYATVAAKRVQDAAKANERQQR